MLNFYQQLRSKCVSFQEAYQQFLKKHSLDKVGLEPGFAGKLRDRSSGRKVDL